MKLLVISDMSHYSTGDGDFVGWGPTVQEIDELSRLFDQVLHVAVLRDGEPPESALPYRASNVALKLVPPSGGNSIGAKLGILRRAPYYLMTCFQEIRRHDAVHVRCPANIPLLSLLLLALMPWQPRWVKYAGNWNPERRDPVGYRMQRWLLRRNVHRGLVTVNGRWIADSAHVVSFYNPTLTQADLLDARRSVSRRCYGEPVRLICVGRVEEEKGVGRALAVLQELRTRGIDAAIDVVGDGPDQLRFEAEALRSGMDDFVTFHGWRSKLELTELYSCATFMLMLSVASEGLPKVVCEAIAFGCLPVTSAISSLPQVLAEAGAGRALKDTSASNVCDTLEQYLADPLGWEAEALRGVHHAERFSYEHYLDEVSRLFSRLGLVVERMAPTRYAPERSQT